MNTCRGPKSKWRPSDKQLHGSYCEIGRKQEAKAIDAAIPIRKWR